MLKTISVYNECVYGDAGSGTPSYVVFRGKWKSDR